ncbi:receptor-like protein 6 [Lycium ferocissimum]|uniref:receptor-like protein 6 n=1 Tax=Lycium ferocissimum TaxID=112874 RepID=UPI002814D805|nr:receptor-like protein 6 [Lycium ferocissimum]
MNYTNLEVVSLLGVNISSPIPMNVSSSLRYVDLVNTNLQGVLTESFFLLPNLEKLILRINDLVERVLPKIHPSNTLLELDISFTGICGELPDSIGTLRSLSHLNLGGCDLSGSIPDSIGNLTEIRELNFRGTNFTGHIPSTISKLRQLTFLDLSSNFLEGEIPNVFSNLQELVELYLSRHSFVGPFPSSILSLTHFQSLDLSSNSLYGPLPNNASMLQKLTCLNLSNNSLNGTMPSWAFSLPSLSGLWFDHNRFSGLADELKMNPTLEILDLSHNQLCGPVLRSLGNLTNLVTFDLSSNNITSDEGVKITFPSLTCLYLSFCELKAFPHFLRNSKALEFLDLSNNAIHGPIPNWFSSMRWDSLLNLNLSHNSLISHLEQLHNYHNLLSLDVKFNFLQGPLPFPIRKLNNLRLLDLSHNHLSESIPHCLGSMAELVILDLRKNNFTGSLPSLCARSTSLTTIAFNHNQLEGAIPLSLHNCRQLEIFDVGNNAINYTFPAWLGTLPELRVLVLTRTSSMDL